MGSQTVVSLGRGEMSASGHPKIKEEAVFPLSSG